jgi:metal-responsive CopG/Arc/MetJ family transcriptional regulator
MLYISHTLCDINLKERHIIMSTTKIHVTCDPELLKRLNKFSGKRRRSKFITEAIREKISREELKSIVSECAGAWKIKNHKNLKTINSVIEEINNLRKDSDIRLKELYNE